MLQICKQVQAFCCHSSHDEQSSSDAANGHPPNQDMIQTVYQQHEVI